MEPASESDNEDTSVSASTNIPSLGHECRESTGTTRSARYEVYSSRESKPLGPAQFRLYPCNPLKSRRVCKVYERYCRIKAGPSATVAGPSPVRILPAWSPVYRAMRHMAPSAVKIYLRSAPENRRPKNLFIQSESASLRTHYQVPDSRCNTGKKTTHGSKDGRSV